MLDEAAFDKKRTLTAKERRGVTKHPRYWKKDLRRNSVIFMSEPNIYEMSESIASTVKTRFRGVEVFAVLTAMRLATIHLEIQSETARQAEFLASLYKLPVCFGGNATTSEPDSSREAGG
jgi:hypothetical protein